MSQSAQTTQSHIRIAQIRKSVVYMKDGSLRQVLEVTPINFALKEEGDKKGIIGQFQNFLNTLNFPVQITIHSRRIDILPYLNQLEKYISQTSSGLLEMQGRDYLQFVRKLTEIAEIMEKRVYVIVPYHPSGGHQSGGFFARLFGGNSNQLNYSTEELKRLIQGLQERSVTVANALKGMGVESKVLNTQELIELYYKFYNPEESSVEKLVSGSDINATLIQSVTEKSTGRRNDTSAPNQSVSSASQTNTSNQQANEPTK